MNDQPKHLVRADDLRETEAVLIRHPKNPNSEVHIQPLSDRVGMKRAHLSVARVPPGKESYIPHAHGTQEEFLFILEGEGLAQIGDEKVRVGPGDYMGFPIDGTVHHLTNVGSKDLVYLQGGERHDLEIGFFPTIGKVSMFRGDGVVTLFDDATSEKIPMSAWFPKGLPGGGKHE